MIDFGELPSGWKEITLAELGIGRTEGILPADFSEEIFELWSVPAFPTGEPEILVGTDIGSNKQRVQPGDVLLCKINPRINRVWKVGQKTQYTQIASTEWIVLRVPEIEPDFLVHRFRERGFRDALCADVAGVGGSLIRARPQSVEKLQITLPPLNEQRRIVAKIEALMARSQQVKEALEAIPPLLNQFRQSVLAAAFRGDLTADWREKNADVEPASVLLERIRAERHRRWEEAELEKMKSSGILPKDDTWKTKYKEPESVDALELPELPAQWCWLVLELVADAIDPQPSHRTPSEVPHGVPYVGIGDINENGVINFDGARKVSQEVLMEHKLRYTLKDGDFIFGKIGTLGKPVRLPTNFDYTLSANVILVQPRSLFVLNSWLFFFMKSPFIENILAKDSRATSQAAFGIKKIRLIPIPLPPLQEQKQIILRLEEHLLTADKLASFDVVCLGQVELLNQSILAKAFRGELVPQDPNDEPASLLLERIRAERAKREAEAKAAKKSTSKTTGQLSRKAKQQDLELIQLGLPGLE